MLEIISTSPFQDAIVWWHLSWTDTVAAIKRDWTGTGRINAYGYSEWINNADDLAAFCDYISTWSNENCVEKP